MSILRKDPLSDSWVIFSEERTIRPQLFIHPETRLPVPAVNYCPFCPGHESETPPEIRAHRPNGGHPNGPDWQIRTIPNKFAVLRVEEQLRRHGDGIYDTMEGVGAHEIIIETPNHDSDIVSYPLDHLVRLLAMYRERATDLMRDERLRYIQLFRNYGFSAGQALSHPHSQIIALPIIPSSVQDVLRSVSEHYEQKERCLLCDIISQEIKDRSRVILENDAFLCICPFASKFPFEAQIYPKRHQAFFTTTTDEELPQLATALQVVLRALKNALADPPYNYILHFAPSYSGEQHQRLRRRLFEEFHWYVEVIPRITRLAGFEVGTGCFINPTLPEKAAAYLRDMIVSDPANRK
ncbi:MAG: galactose-1-phosphate uridylyltransferase [bacterium]